MINEDFYYLTLEGVTVDGGSTQYLRPDGSEDEENKGNIIIDSGAALTYLPLEIYEGLEADLVKAVSGQRVDSPYGSSNLCYQGEDFQAPSVVMHFSGGADVVLEQDNTFTNYGQGIMCLTMVPMSPNDNGLPIFGNLNQMNYWIEYDIVGKKVNFKKSDCAAESAARLIG
ncbi:Aspartic proteinase CDR1 [Striga hermonthica]|uniref:Aspartic proteinase CDR1 n=1 Tax=Striga hermonthica TaxID=68872 RepID=A0A9N7R3Q7_STRHE|nr:Aspartic proteinase CDR1 [Striga hermonthica]